MADIHINLGPVSEAVAADTYLLNVTDTLTGDLTATNSVISDTMIVAGGSITDSSGAISFGNENLLTTGTLKAGTASSASGAVAGLDTSGNTFWAIGRASDGASSISFRNNADTTYNARLSADDATGMQLAASGTTFLTSDGSNINVTGKLQVDQALTTGAMPVLTLDQGDISEEFIRLIGSSTTDASQSLVDAVDLTTPGTLSGWIKVYIEDVQVTNPITDGVYYVPFYTAPTA